MGRVTATNAKGFGALFDIFNIFFLILAVVIFVMLRNALGRRTGHERPPFDPYSRTDTGATDTGTEDKVISLPRSRRPADADADLRPDTPAEDIAWDKYAAPGTRIADGLKEIARTEPSFHPGEFLDGAKVAYEMIVTAFADGDRKTLGNLLAKPVYDGFVEAIDAREARGERVESNFVGINTADIVDAALKGRAAHVTVKFRSQLVSATRDGDGEVVEGDPTAVRDVTDIWTFERDVSSHDPNWKLAATEAAH